MKHYHNFGRSFHSVKKKIHALFETDIPWFVKKANEIFCRKKLPRLCHNQLIEQAFAKSPNDQRRKTKTDNYYFANATAFIETLGLLFDKTTREKFESNKIPDKVLLAYNYHRVIKEMLLDSLILLNDFSDYKNACIMPFEIIKNTWQHNVTIYSTLKQTIFGQASFHSFIDVEQNLSIPIIRQLIELRIRRGFGTIAWYDSACDRIEPIAMNILFDTIRPYLENIQFSIPFNNIVRLNGWANNFLHSGIKEYSWKPIFLAFYLKEFLIGGKTGPNSFNAYSGIRVPKGIILKIREDLKAMKIGGDLVLCEPEAVIIDA